MTHDDHVREPSDCGRDAAAYVLGALTSEEAEAFRRHLGTCVVCRDEVAALKVAADSLPLAASQLPAPRRLRRRVVSDVHKQPSGVPAVGARRSPRTGLARGAVALGGALAVAAAVGVVVLASSGSSRARIVQASVSAPTGSAVVRLSG